MLTIYYPVCTVSIPSPWLSHHAISPLIFCLLFWVRLCNEHCAREDHGNTQSQQQHLLFQTPAVLAAFTCYKTHPCEGHIQTSAVMLFSEPTLIVSNFRTDFTSKGWPTLDAVVGCCSSLNAKCLSEGLRVAQLVLSWWHHLWRLWDL